MTPTTKFEWRGADNPEAREELEALARDKAFGKMMAKLKAELANRMNDLKRAPAEKIGEIQGRVAALEFATGLPQQLYAAAGGKRALFDPLAGEVEADGE